MQFFFINNSTDSDADADADADDDAAADDDDDDDVVVAEARPDQVDLMLREGCFTKGLQHSNISCLLATCGVHLEEPPLLIYPFLDEGNLKKFLQRCKISDVGLNQVWLL